MKGNVPPQKLCIVKFKLQAINPHTLKLRKPASYQEIFKGKVNMLKHIITTD